MIARQAYTMHTPCITIFFFLVVGTATAWHTPESVNTALEDKNSDVWN